MTPQSESPSEAIPPKEKIKVDGGIMILFGTHTGKTDPRFPVQIEVSYARDSIIKYISLAESESLLREARLEGMVFAFELAAAVERPYTIEAYRSHLRLLASEQRDALALARSVVGKKGEK